MAILQMKGNIWTNVHGATAENTYNEDKEKLTDVTYGLPGEIHVSPLEGAYDAENDQIIFEKTLEQILSSYTVFDLTDEPKISGFSEWISGIIVDSVYDEHGFLGYTLFFQVDGDPNHGFELSYSDGYDNNIAVRV